MSEERSRKKPKERRNKEGKRKKKVRMSPINKMK